MGLDAGVEYNLTRVDSKTFIMSNPMPESTLSPSQALGFGLGVLSHFSAAQVMGHCPVFQKGHSTQSAVAFSHLIFDTQRRTSTGGPERHLSRVDLLEELAKESLQGRHPKRIRYR
jgi:hypothetical protein